VHFLKSRVRIYYYSIPLLITDKYLTSISSESLEIVQEIVSQVSSPTPISFRRSSAVS